MEEVRAHGKRELTIEHGSMAMALEVSSARYLTLSAWLIGVRQFAVSGCCTAFLLQRSLFSFSLPTAINQRVDVESQTATRRRPLIPYTVAPSVRGVVRDVIGRCLGSPQRGRRPGTVSPHCLEPLAASRMVYARR